MLVGFGLGAQVYEHDDLAHGLPGILGVAGVALVLEFALDACFLRLVLALAGAARLLVDLLQSRGVARARVRSRGFAGLVEAEVTTRQAVDIVVRIDAGRGLVLDRLARLVGERAARELAPELVALLIGQHVARRAPPEAVSECEFHRRQRAQGCRNDHDVDDAGRARGEIHVGGRPPQPPVTLM